MKRCTSCREFIANSAHNCPKCGAYDPFKIIEKESMAEEEAAQRAHIQMHTRHGTGTPRDPVSFEDNLIVILGSSFYLFVAFPLFLSDIHTFFKVVVGIISVPIVILVIAKGDA